MKRLILPLGKSKIFSHVSLDKILVSFSLSLAYVLPTSEQELSRTDRQYSEPCIWKCSIIACVTAPCPPCIWRCEPIPTQPPTEVYKCKNNLEKLAKLE